MQFPANLQPPSCWLLLQSYLCLKIPPRSDSKGCHCRVLNDCAALGASKKAAGILQACPSIWECAFRALGCGAATTMRYLIMPPLTTRSTHSNNSFLQADRTRLLYDDYPAGHGYGTWGASSVPPQNVMSPEEVQREQEALDNITRWASEYALTLNQVWFVFSLLTSICAAKSSRSFHINTKTSPCRPTRSTDTLTAPHPRHHTTISSGP